MPAQASSAADRLTPEQRRALEVRRASVGLSAGAGCGKTFVLTERFLSHLEPRPGHKPARLGELVAITFTDRAAREMRDRIREACGERLLRASDADAPYWLDLVRELDAARISTIHSFCASLLRSHAVEAGLDPRFRVLQQTEADTLLFELIDDALRQRLAGGDEAVIDLVVQFGLERLYEMVRSLLGRRQDIDFAAWRDESPEGLAARWEKRFVQDTLPRMVRRVADAPAARELLQIVQAADTDQPKLRERFRILGEKLAGLRESPDPLGELAAIRLEARVQGVAKKLWPGDEVYEAFQKAAESLRKEIDKCPGPDDFKPQAAVHAALASLRVLRLAHDVAGAYEQEKRAVAGLDFNDLLIRAKALLDGPEGEPVRGRLSSQIRELLVDEFQDTDPLQVGLVRALCGDGLLAGKLFFVGDYKQSIYRFRGADPHVFQELRGSLPEEGRLPLTRNFRSQPAVLDFVNALFCEELGPEFEPLVASRQQISPTPAVEFLWAPDDEPEKGDGANLPRSGPEGASHKLAPSPFSGRAGRKERLRRREADWIARRIRAMLDSPEPLLWDEEAARRGQPALRRARMRDVALLFRALSDVQFYEEALRRYNIDYYLVGGHAFYAQQEIYDLLNLLRAVAVPGDEVSLAGALRSPFFSLHDETLYWLAQRPGGLSAGLFAAELPGELDGQQRQRAACAAATLAALREVKDRVPVADFVQQALDRTAYDAALLAEFLGERKLANLRKLVDQARAMDRAGIFTLADFITQLAEFVARQPDEPLAATHPESTDVVRLMTVHQAKGLEFPVVVVPDVDRAMRGPASPVAFAPGLGPMVKPPDTEGIVGLDMHRATEADEERAELVRLLYVAATRAADCLILSGGVADEGKPGPWRDLLGRRFDLQTGELLASLPKGYAAPEVRVTASEPSCETRPHAPPGRRDLDQLADKALELAAQGAGRVPQYLAPVPPDPGARRQFSFSRLSGMLHAKAAAAQLADAHEEGEGELPEPRIDPLGLGTLVHAALAEIDFRQPGDVAALVRRHAARHLPDNPAGAEEARELIERFLQSARARELAAARQVLPEVEFLLAWPPVEGGLRAGTHVAGRVRAGTHAPESGSPGIAVHASTHPTGGHGRVRASTHPTGTPPEGRYLQGFIDCLYQDAAGRWRILDYKTNRATAETVPDVAAGYEMQMLVYGLAIEQILGEPPAELVLCFLRPGLERPFAWDAAGRARVVELVEGALAAIEGGGRRDEG